MALAVFAAVDAWVFATLRSSLRATAAETRRDSLDLLAKSAPEDVALRYDWLASAAESLPGGAAVYLVPDEDDPALYEAFAADDAALELWNGIASSEDAGKGLESAYYFENYASAVRATLSDIPVRLFYAPATDDSQGELLGIAVFMAPEAADSGIERLGPPESGVVDGTIRQNVYLGSSIETFVTTEYGELLVQIDDPAGKRIAAEGERVSESFNEERVRVLPASIG